MHKSLVILSTVVLLPILCFCQSKPAAKALANAPNVIFIVVDDMGYGDVGFNGCKDIPTPNIDRIAKAGVVFTSGHVSYSVCSPSRAGLLTGRYQYRFGYERNPLYVPSDIEMGLPLTEETIADILGRSGYTSMIIGKWHLGAHKDLHPLKRGFNEFYGFLGGGHQYFPDRWTLENPEDAKGESESYRTKLNRNYTPVMETEYITDAFSREAVSFVDRNKQKPFFLYLAYNAPHAPLQATEKYLDRFQNIENQKRRTYAAMVSAVDDGVGKLLDKLDETGLTKNTMVIFLSDNGGPIADNGSNNGPLRGKKGNIFEGGIRVPFAMQWPNHIPSHTIYDKPVISLDLLSTVLANVTNSAIPKNPLDGVNLIPFITGKQTGSPHDFLYWRQFDQKSYAVINQDEKKLVILKDSTFLYDLKKEISEKSNLSNENPSVTDAMNKHRLNWEKGMKDPVFLGLMQREEYNKRKGNAIHD